MQEKSFLLEINLRDQNAVLCVLEGIDGRTTYKSTPGLFPPVLNKSNIVSDGTSYPLGKTVLDFPDRVCDRRRRYELIVMYP